MLINIATTSDPEPSISHVIVNAPASFLPVTMASQSSCFQIEAYDSGITISDRNKEASHMSLAQRLHIGVVLRDGGEMHRMKKKERNMTRS